MYRAPVAEIAFTLKHVAGLGEALSAGAFPDLTEDLLDSVLAEAGRFATDELAPLDRLGDREGARLVDGAVTMPSGWREAYRTWCAAGWNGISAAAHAGGQGLPLALSAATQEMWNGAAMAFALCPMLTMGAVEALERHGSEALKRLVLAKLVAGEWTGTMNLTEPQAGSDVGALTTRAEPQDDGSYRLFGQKIFITYGEHDLADNIVHLVLARLAGAPDGSRGISLFAVPKILPDPRGGSGARNDVVCAGLERKLGIHGAPTCTMIYGGGLAGDRPGARGWLLGEPNRGLATMFTMMNNARLMVGVQGVGLAERATQLARAYAAERRQGRAPGRPAGEASPIAEHPDVRRMLMTMEGLTAAARAICYSCAVSADLARVGTLSDTASSAMSAADWQVRADLLTPVAKAFATDAGFEVASLGIQVFGGAGYLEETGAAQILRDARIPPIYEGTNGIQAIDLVTRKLSADGGAAVRRLIADLRDVAESCRAANRPDFGRMGMRLAAALDDLQGATDYLLALSGDRAEVALAGATLYLRLFGLAAGTGYLAKGALASRAADGADGRARIAAARFFAERLAPETCGLKIAVTEGADALLEDVSSGPERGASASAAPRSGQQA